MLNGADVFYLSIYLYIYIYTIHLPSRLSKYVDKQTTGPIEYLAMHLSDWTKMSMDFWGRKQQKSYLGRVVLRDEQMRILDGPPAPSFSMFKEQTSICSEVSLMFSLALQGSLNYPFGRDQTWWFWGNSLINTLFGLVTWWPLQLSA